MTNQRNHFYIIFSSNIKNNKTIKMAIINLTLTFPFMDPPQLVTNSLSDKTNNNNFHRNSQMDSQINLDKEK